MNAPHPLFNREIHGVADHRRRIALGCLDIQASAFNLLYRCIVVLNHDCDRSGGSEIPRDFAVVHKAHAVIALLAHQRTKRYIIKRYMLAGAGRCAVSVQLSALEQIDRIGNRIHDRLIARIFVQIVAQELVLSAQCFNALVTIPHEDLRWGHSFEVSAGKRHLIARMLRFIALRLICA